MDAYVLPLTLDSWQVMTLDLKIDGEEFHAQVEVRYLPAPDQWFVSIWDHSSSELLVNKIPLICSYAEVNDLFLGLSVVALALVIWLVILLIRDPKGIVRKALFSKKAG